MEKLLVLVSNSDLLNTHYFFIAGFILTMIVLFIGIPQKQKFVTSADYRLALQRYKRDRHSWSALQKYVWGAIFPTMYIFRLIFVMNKTFDTAQVMMIIMWIIFIGLLSNLIKYSIVNYYLSKR